jgi:hypothetical protein
LRRKALARRSRRLDAFVARLLGVPDVCTPAARLLDVTGAVRSTVDITLATSGSVRSI